jgi:hypothetical protein
MHQNVWVIGISNLNIVRIKAQDEGEFEGPIWIKVPDESGFYQQFLIYLDEMIGIRDSKVDTKRHKS